MATTALIRACSKGSRGILLQMQGPSSCITTKIASKPFTASSSMAMMEYFQARRGPFTPEEKQGSGHMMSASTHWKAERVVSVVMVGLMPVAVMMQGQAMDHILTTAIYLHGFWGVNTVLEDYAFKFVPWLGKVWYVIGIIGFAGLVNFNYNDVGLCKAISMFWAA